MAEESIVLVHGLWMNGLDMSVLRQRLTRAGFKTLRFSYDSRSSTPRENAVRLYEFIDKNPAPVIHFVGHSLGGIVIRHLFYDFPSQRPGRVVTLGTPHRPSRSAYRFSRLIPGRFMLGRSTIDGLLGNVPPWGRTHDLGSVAGDLSIGFGRLFPGLPRPNDGTVTVAETRFDGMRDHAIVHTSHMGLVFNTEAARLCSHFIREGHF